VRQGPWCLPELIQQNRLSHVADAHVHHLSLAVTILAVKLSFPPLSRQGLLDDLPASIFLMLLATCDAPIDTLPSDLLEVRE
jgi:hypothetical protein